MMTPTWNHLIEKAWLNPVMATTSKQVKFMDVHLFIPKKGGEQEKSNMNYQETSQYKKKKKKTYYSNGGIKDLRPSSNHGLQEIYPRSTAITSFGIKSMNLFYPAAQWQYFLPRHLSRSKRISSSPHRYIFHGEPPQKIVQKY